ncbi:glycosyltransferase family 4 protein [Nocardioides aestuarii]|uniref:Glycosyltransferase family 4 protein n=1 Tax=Nocardioides aestuarii TaxID=252231 RepID=A0ABW4TN65_9ACTN
MSGRRRVVHVVAPAGVDDPAEPSGGNTYDRQLSGALEALGWTVHLHRTRAAGLRDVLAALEPGSAVVLDGLVASGQPRVVVPQSHVLRLVLLLHLPRGRPGHPDAAEAAVVAAVSSVVTPSEWCRRLVLATYPVPPAKVRVAIPGVVPTDRVTAGADRGTLLVVAAVTRSKGHDVLLHALRDLVDLPWRVRCVGPLTRDPSFVSALAEAARSAGLADRFLLEGPLVGDLLTEAYTSAGVLVLPSRGETYGMVLTEALAHGLPVVASAVGGTAEALGLAPTGARPGLLVPPNDADALGAALRSWLTDAGLRAELRAGALVRRRDLPRWDATARQVAATLTPAASDVRTPA